MLIIIVKLDPSREGEENYRNMKKFYSKPVFSGIKGSVEDEDIFYHVGIVDYF